MSDGAAISVASKPRPIEMALHSLPALFDTFTPFKTMSDVCSICIAMLWNALPEQSDVEMLPRSAGGLRMEIFRRDDARDDAVGDRAGCLGLEGG